MFEALFKGVSTRFGLRTIETSVENPDLFFCSSFQNPRLGSINFRGNKLQKSHFHASVESGIFHTCFITRGRYGEQKLAQFYPSQTKILEGGTKDEMRMCEALFKGVSTQCGPLTIEKCITHPHLIFCSAFQNLRLGSINFAPTTSRRNLHA